MRLSAPRRQPPLRRKSSSLIPHPWLVPCATSAPATVLFTAALLVILWTLLSIRSLSILEQQLRGHSDHTNYQPPFHRRRDGVSSAGEATDDFSYRYEDGVAEWSHPLIHIVNTRFMQEQGNLQSLARARLLLFEKFCFPTVVRQSVYNYTDFDPSPNAARSVVGGATENVGKAQSMNAVEQIRVMVGQAGYANETKDEGEEDEDLSDPPFLWIIKIDPHLDSVILADLIDLVRPHREIILLGSTINFGIGIKGGGWRGGQAGRDILQTAAGGGLYSGDLDLVRRAHAVREERIVLETRLDADDGLNSLYLEKLQRDALDDLYAGYEMDDDGESSIAYKGKSDNSTSLTINNQKSAAREAIGTITSNPFPPGVARWLYWCPLNHIAWDPNHFGENPATNPNVSSYGTFIPWRSPRGCITAGLTVGASVGLVEDDIPRFPHHEIVEKIRYGMGRPDTGRCGLFNRTQCLRMVEHPKMGALRSRTPTSAGMRGVVTQENNKPMAHILMEQRAKDPKVRSSMWHVLSHYFAITEEVATEVNRFVMDHFVDIVKDNLRGQCTRGHSCKVSAKEELQRLLDLATEGEVGGLQVQTVE